MVQSERDLRQELVLEAARRMMVAARTAPKGKGIDVIEIGLVTGEDIKRLSAEMEHIYRETGFKFLLRDAENLGSAGAVVIIGTRQQVQALNCGHSAARSRRWCPARSTRSIWVSRSVPLAPWRLTCVSTRGSCLAPAWPPSGWDCLAIASVSWPSRSVARRRILSSTGSRKLDLNRNGISVKMKFYGKHVGKIWQ